MPELPSPDEMDAEPIPISALQHAVYCLRQAALIHLERLWVENRFTAEGQVLHRASGEPTSRKARGVRRETALNISSRRLGIAGVADLVEFRPAERDEVPYPVEFKRGKPKRHRADEVQLCAQALCLEEMTGSRVSEGALFYAQTKRRVVVRFDAELRRYTEETIASLREVFLSLRTPKAVYSADRCRGCSLLELCHPRSLSRSARAWRDRTVAQVLQAEEGS
jgi:CRISPR-associated exonuclease Cas4